MGDLSDDDKGSWAWWRRCKEAVGVVGVRGCGGSVEVTRVG